MAIKIWGNCNHNRERERASLPAAGFPKGRIPLRRAELLDPVNPAPNPPFEVPNVGVDEPNPAMLDDVFCLPVKQNYVRILKKIPFESGPNGF
jgi:hypothetical protein